MIRFRCKRCKQKIGVPVEYAARLVRCPECRQPVRVPVESQFDGVDLASARVLDDLRALAAGQALTREEQALDGRLRPEQALDLGAEALLSMV